MGRVLRAALVWLFAWGLLACPPDDDAEPDADSGVASDVGIDGPFVRIGTGFPSYRAIPDDGVLTIVQGIQGGYHVWGGFLVVGLQPREVAIDFVVELAGAEIGSAAYEDDLRDAVVVEGRDGYSYAGVAVIFDEDVVVQELSGRSVLMTLRLQDREGVMVTDTTEVIVRCCAL